MIRERFFVEKTVKKMKKGIYNFRIYVIMSYMSRIRIYRTEREIAENIYKSRGRTIRRQCL